MKWVFSRMYFFFKLDVLSGLLKMPVWNSWTQAVEAVHLKKKGAWNQKNFEREEYQNVEKQGHMYERERTEELGHSLFCHMSEMG